MTDEIKPKIEKSFNPILDLYTGMSEQTFYRSTYWLASQYAPYNPDDLFTKTNSYSIHEEMLNDDQVDVCMQIKKDLIIGSGSDVICEESSKISQDIQRDLRVALYEDPDIPFDEMLEGIISAYFYGFSLSEKIFKYRDDGSITLKNIKTRHPSSWLINTDDHGNVTSVTQHGPNGDIAIEPKCLLHMINNRFRTFGGPYGMSDLRSAYNAYFVKRQVIKWYAIFLEKAASPTPIAKYDKNAPQAAVNDIHNAIKSLQTKTAMTIPKEIEIEFLESKTNGDAYRHAINIFNMFIGRALLIPDLLGFQGSETAGGSYSLGKDQIAIFLKHIARRRSTLERIINKEICWPIIVHNHGFVNNAPKFRFNPVDDAHMLELTKLWIEVTKGKAYQPSDEEINHFRSIVRFPQGIVERDIAKSQVMTDNQNRTHSRPFVTTPNDIDESIEGPIAQKQPVPFDEKTQKKSILSVNLPGSYDKKVDYAAIKSSMDSFVAMVVKECDPVIKRIFDDLYEQIKVKKILQNQAIEKIDTLKIKSPRDINLILKRGLRDGYKLAQQVGRSEILKGVNFRAPLASEDFLNFLDQETFQYIGDWSYDIKKKVAIKLREAIRDGKPMSAVFDDIDADIFPQGVDSLERYARTKYTDVMNRGRLKSFEDSGVVAAYQYSAILDDRTSAICEELNGKIFTSGDEPIPPMHFNCRSLLIPITKYEDWQADDKTSKGDDLAAFIENNKGDGFSKR